MNWLGKKLISLHKWCNKREWLLLLVLIVIIARIPTLVTPHYYGDEEIYFVMGRAWSHGVPLYEAMFDHKPPLIYILAGLLPTVALFRAGLMLSMVVHTVLFYKLSELFWDKKYPWLAKLSQVIFVILSTIPAFEGNIVNAELLMMMPVTAGLLLIYRDIQDQKTHYKPIRYLVAGLLAGIGWLYKIPVVLDWLAIALYLAVFLKNSLWESVKGIFDKRLWLLMGGFVLPLALSFVYYYLKGHGESYLATVVSVNLGYVSSWKSDSFTTFNPFKSGLVVRAAILAGYSLGLYIMRKKLNPRLLFAALWLGFSLFGALLSYRPYPHYLQEIVAPIALIVPTLFITTNLIGWVLWAVIIWLSILTQKDVGFWAYSGKNVFLGFWQLVTMKISRDEYMSGFDNTQRNYKIADYINNRIDSMDQIYVWGSDPTIYNLTNKLPSGGKYIVSFHVHDLNKFDYVMQNLEKSNPAAIVILPGSEHFPALEGMVESAYTKAYEIDGAVVYWRVR